MNLHHGHAHAEGEVCAPCAHMEKLLRANAEGKSRGIRKWYAEAHAGQCAACNDFRNRLAHEKAGGMDE